MEEEAVAETVPAAEGETEVAAVVTADQGEPESALDRANAELAALRAEYATFRITVVRVGQEEAARRGWCGEWRDIAIERIGLRREEFPPTHAFVTVNVGGVDVQLKTRLASDGGLKSNRHLRLLLAEELRSGAMGNDLTALFGDSSAWFTVTSFASDGDD